MSSIDKLNEGFWNESLNEYEAKGYQKAGFQSPVDFFDIPFIGLASVTGMNYETALDVLFGMAEYSEMPETSQEDLAGEIDRQILEMGFDPEFVFIADKERVYMNMDEILYRAGYDGEATARLTVRQMLNLKDLSIDKLQALADTVWLAYLSRYIQPEEEFSTRAELIKGKKLLFGMRRSEA